MVDIFEATNLEIRVAKQEQYYEQYNVSDNA